jgi:hypothetical protein
MLGNLAVVLMGLAAIVALLTFVGAHSSPINIPNISKAGCLVTASLIIVGFGAGMYEPVARYNACRSVCEEALADVLGDHGEADVYVSPGRVEYKACHKGAKQAEAKARNAAEKNNTTMTFEVEAPEMLEARCQSQGSERCTMACFEGITEEIEDGQANAGS